MEQNPFERKIDIPPDELHEQLSAVFMKVLKATRSSYGGVKLTKEDRAFYFKDLQADRNIIVTAFSKRLEERSVLSIITHLQSFSDYDLEKPHKNDFVWLGNSLFEELQPQVEEALKKGFVGPDDVFRAYANLAEFGDSEQGTLAVQSLGEHLDLIEKGLISKNDYSFYTTCLLEVLSYGKPEVRTKALVMLRRIVAEIMDKPKFPALVSKLFSAQPESSMSARVLEGAEAVKVFLERHGLPSTEVYSAWLQSSSPHSNSEEETSGTFDSVMYSNLETVRSLEVKSPGVCKFLYDEFNIADFGRYPVELLLKQREEFNSLKNPYGVIIYPRADWNEAFYNDRLALEELYNKLEGEFSLRVAECEGKVDVARILKKCDLLYNPEGGGGHKISLLILGGHGSQNSIRFGKEDKRHVLYTEDLARKVAGKSGEYLDENPTIILASCSTGADKGIGRELSARFGAKVVAPKEPTGIWEFYANRDRNGKFRFNAQYTKKGVKNIFKQGEPVKK